MQDWRMYKIRCFGFVIVVFIDREFVVDMGGP